LQTQQVRSVCQEGLRCGGTAEGRSFQRELPLSAASGRPWSPR